MDFSKKCVFLVLFLGIVSLSNCEKEKREESENDEENGATEEKRGLAQIIKGAAKVVTSLADILKKKQ